MSDVTVICPGGARVVGVVAGLGRAGDRWDGGGWTVVAATCWGAGAAVGAWRRQRFEGGRLGNQAVHSGGTSHDWRERMFSDARITLAQALAQKIVELFRAFLGAWKAVGAGISDAILAIAPARR